MAQQKGCYSWLGYIVPVYVFTNPASGLFKTLKSVIWSYITALADGKTAGEAEAALKAAYAAHFNDHWLFKFNHSKLMLRANNKNVRLHTHNRVIIWRANVKVTALFAHGPQNRNAWACFAGLGWKHLWPAHDAQVVSMMAALASAKSKNRPVSFLEDDRRVKRLYA